MLKKESFLYKQQIGLLACLLAFVCSSCASIQNAQQRWDQLSSQYSSSVTLSTIEEKEDLYAQTDDLLSQYHYGTYLHLKKRYTDSIKVFEKAKRRYDQLYTRSLTRRAFTWLINDNVGHYRGEDYERVMINVFQALNYALAGDFQEALVEARDAESVLSLINRQYKKDQKNVYREDAFARLVMGILYEASGRSVDLNNAVISYKKAIDIYEKDYTSHYNVEIPKLLKENILSLSEIMGEKERKRYQSKFPDIKPITYDKKRGMGQVYFIQYHGQAPVKHQTFVPFHLPDGSVGKIAFPVYRKKRYSLDTTKLKVKSKGGRSIRVYTELVEDIEDIAIQSLENHRVRDIAKTTLRASGKYALGKFIKDKVDDKAKGNKEWIKHLASLYSVSSEYADLRSWTTLPAQIKMGRVMLEPGEYQALKNGQLLGTIDIKAGDIKFFIVDTM